MDREMSFAVMQPYFAPYLGYFQLINAVDKFIIYDNVQYTKKGWFNRNRLLFNGKPEFFTINIKKDSDYLDVYEREVSEVYFEKEQNKLINKIKQSYRKAPNFESVFPLVRKILAHEEPNLFQFIYHSVVEICQYLQIDTELVVSSTIPIDHSKKNKYRLKEFYDYLQASSYINPIGGREIYAADDFAEMGMQLHFLDPVLTPYNQLQDDFVPGLSIIDVMMYNSVEEIQPMLTSYNLLS